MIANYANEGGEEVATLGRCVFSSEGGGPGGLINSIKSSNQIKSTTVDIEKYEIQLASGSYANEMQMRCK